MQTSKYMNIEEKFTNDPRKHTSPNMWKRKIETRVHSINEARFRFKVKPVSNSLHTSNGLLAVNDAICDKDSDIIGQVSPKPVSNLQIEPTF